MRCGKGQSLEWRECEKSCFCEAPKWRRQGVTGEADRILPHTEFFIWTHCYCILYIFFLKCFFCLFYVWVLKKNERKRSGIEWYFDLGRGWHRLSLWLTVQLGVVAAALVVSVAAVTAVESYFSWKCGHSLWNLKRVKWNAVMFFEGYLCIFCIIKNKIEQHTLKSGRINNNSGCPIKSSDWF